MEHVVLAFVLIAFILLGMYVLDRRDRGRHTREHLESDRAEALSKYHVTH